MDGTLIVGRNDQSDKIYQATNFEGEAMTYALDLHFQPNEKFFAGLTGYWMLLDAANTTGDHDAKTYAGYMGFNFTPNIALKGIYYMQDLGANLANGFDDSPKAWKAILDVKQDALKFTSLWVEYSQQDNNFWNALYDRYAIGGSNYDYVGYNLGIAPKNDGSTNFLFVKADQKWNDKWSTFVRYAKMDADTAGLDDATEWGLGVGYQYSPAIYFELAYAEVDHGTNTFVPTGANVLVNDKESVVRFRTNVSF